MASKEPSEAKPRSKPTDSTAYLGFEADFGPPADAGPNSLHRDLHSHPHGMPVVLVGHFNHRNTFRLN